MTMQSHRGGRFEQFSIEGGKDPDDVVGPGRTAYDPPDAIDRFEELADDERDGFDPFDFFLSSEEFSAEVMRLVEDVFLSSTKDDQVNAIHRSAKGYISEREARGTRLLQAQELSMSLELLEPRIQLFIPGR